MISMGYKLSFSFALFFLLLLQGLAWDHIEMYTKNI